MSPIRTSAYREMMFVNDMGTMSPYNSVAQLGSPSSINPITTHASERLRAAPVSRKRRSPNAFIMFRSHFIASKRVPPGVVHQNDVSRYVAEVWKSKLTPSERAVFFKMAQEEKVRFELEGPREPAKKRRSRSKKASQLSSLELTAEACLPPSPTLALDTSAVPRTPPSSLDVSPQIYSSSNFYPTSPDYDGSVSLSAPQPTHAILPTLLNWGNPVEYHVLTPEEQGFAAFHYPIYTTASNATNVGIESHAPLTDLDFNAVCLDVLLSSMDIAFTDFASHEFLFASTFEGLF